MIFPEGSSALVRLADCLKYGLSNAVETAEQVVVVLKANAPQIARMREIARASLAGDITQQDADASLKAPDSQIPKDQLYLGAALQARLHSEVLAVVLNACFALESYINALGYHLLRERDILGLVAKANASTIDTFLEAIERMSTLSKWETIGRLRSEKGLEPAKSPFQDLKILFRFRDDHVHDKVVSFGSDRSKKRYGGKFPDPVSGSLELQHAIYACDCYWGMIGEILSLTETPMESFHRHYNLSPYFDSDFEKKVHSISEEYVRVK